MRPRKVHLYLSAQEREQLKAMVRSETLARKKRALALLRADESGLGSGLPLTHIAFAIGVSTNYVSKLVGKAARYGSIKTALGLTPADLAEAESDNG